MTMHSPPSFVIMILIKSLKEFTDGLTDGTALGDASSRVFDGLGKVGVGIISTLTVLVLTFFMLIEGPMWLEKIWQAQPESKRQHRRDMGRKVYQVVTGYVNGQLLIALLASMSSLVVILFLGLPLPLPLAALVGLFGLIPLVGATLGSVAVILVALFQSVYAAAAMLIFFLVYQQIENTFIQPYIQSRTLEVSPLLIFVAVLFGITVGGLLGAFIAIPVAAIARIMFIDFIDQRQQKNEPKKSSKLSLKRSKS